MTLSEPPLLTLTVPKKSLFSFPKNLRLRSRRDFQNVARSRQPVFGKYFIIEKCFSPEKKGPKLGITVTRKFGKSHFRNLFKRRVREIFRLSAPTLSPELYIIVKPKPSALEASFKELLDEFHTLTKNSKN